MKTKILNFLLIISSFFGYLEWVKDNQVFLFVAEIEIIMKLLKDPFSIVHPFTLIPMLGQLLLLFTIFQKKPSKTLTITGLSFLGLLLGFMFIIGIISLNFRILLSTIPFTALAIITVREFLKESKNQKT